MRSFFPFLLLLSLFAMTYYAIGCIPEGRGVPGIPKSLIFPNKEVAPPLPDGMRVRKLTYAKITRWSFMRGGNQGEAYIPVEDCDEVKRRFEVYGEEEDRYFGSYGPEETIPKGTVYIYPTPGGTWFSAGKVGEPRKSKKEEKKTE